MIRLGKDKTLDNYFIDENGVITDLNGEIQSPYLNQGRYKFKGVHIHKIVMYTFYGYKDLDIHHIDENCQNNSLSNLIYLTHSEHSILHNIGRHHTDETKRKISEAGKGRHHTDETKRKISEAGKRRMFSNKSKKKMSESKVGRHWFNDGVKNYFCKECPNGCFPGRIK